MEWRRLVRIYEYSPLVLAGSVTLIAFPLIVLVASLLAREWENRIVQQVQHRYTEQVVRQLNDAQSDFAIAFGQIRHLTAWVAESPQMRQTLKNSAATHDTANEFLQHTATSFSVDIIFLLDARGISIASSNFNTPYTTVGRHYGDRQYFFDAMQGRQGLQFAVGRTTGIGGFFFSAPVRDGARIIGMAGVKLDQPRMVRQIRIPGGLVSDEHGVVVMADNPVHMFRTLPGADVMQMSEEARLNRYARKDFAPLDLARDPAARPGVWRFEGKPALYGSLHMADEALTMHVIFPFDALNDIGDQRRLMYVGTVVGVALALFGLLTGLLFGLRARDYRKRLEEANAELSEQVRHDYLTGCANRRAFVEVLQSEMERARRYGSPLSLAVLDIDHFKEVNDTYGHAFGDTVLQGLVAVINQQLRSNDLLARIGGEEFALLMPSTSVQEAMRVVDRMRMVIEKVPMHTGTTPIFVTISAGVAGWAEGCDGNQLLGEADRALYAAKGGGRNCVMLNAA